MSIEHRIQSAMAEKRDNESLSFTELAEKYNIDRSTLSRRYNGKTSSKAEIASTTYRLFSDEAERAIIQYLKRIAEYGVYVTPKILNNIASHRAGAEVGVHWSARFVQRHQNDLLGVYLNGFDKARQKAQNPDSIAIFFDHLDKLLKKHHVIDANIWNMDEKGFLLGVLKKSRRIVPVRSYQAGRIRGALQDGSREFITIIAAVNVVGTACPPAIIYASESGNLVEGWLDEFQEDDPTQRSWFASSPDGWSSVELGMAWLKLFDKETSVGVGYGSRVLILDGHSSHVDDEFIDYAIDHRIWLVIFPPHATHILQPLDVSLFSPLATAYDHQINDFLTNSGGICSITKARFFGLFWPAWREAFTKKNIESGWEKTGIRLFNPSLIINKLRANQWFDDESSEYDQEEELPVKSYEVRAFIRADQLEPPSEEKEAHLYTMIDQYAQQLDLCMFDNSNLRSSLVALQAKKKGTKLMKLLGDQAPKYGVMWTPSRLARYKEALQKKEEEDEARKAAQATKKALQQAKKEKSIADKAIRRQQAADAKAIKDAQKEQQKAEAEARRIAKAAGQTLGLKRKANEANIDPILLDSEVVGESSNAGQLVVSRNRVNI